MPVQRRSADRRGKSGSGGSCRGGVYLEEITQNPAKSTWNRGLWPAGPCQGAVPATGRVARLERDATPYLWSGFESRRGGWGAKRPGKVRIPPCFARLSTCCYRATAEPDRQRITTSGFPDVWTGGLIQERSSDRRQKSGSGGGSRGVSRERISMSRDFRLKTFFFRLPGF